jgi:anti-anti-sigma factor
MEVRELCRTDERVVATVAGTVDYVTRYDFCAAVQDLLIPPGRQLVLELSQMDFLDSCGLNELLRTRRQVTARGGSLVLAAAPRQVRDLLALTGADTLLPLYDQVTDVCAGPSQPN